jgi:hypothetical protein
MKTLLALLSIALLTLSAQAQYKSVKETGAGILIGKTTTQKVGFFAATPVVQQTGAGRTALQTIGILAADGTTTASATAGAATLSQAIGTVTSEAVTTAAGADYTLTLTNTLITASSYLCVTVDNGTNTTAGLAVGRVTPASGSATILVRNTHASAALNGTIKIRFVILQ